MEDNNEEKKIIIQYNPQRTEGNKIIQRNNQTPMYGRAEGRDLINPTEDIEHAPIYVTGEN